MDPFDDIGVHNGNIFGFDVSYDEADIVIIPVPWDVTASYHKGTAKGPVAILNASVQLDFHHPYLPSAGNPKVFMDPLNNDLIGLNDSLNLKAEPYFNALQKGNYDGYDELLDNINKAHAEVKVTVNKRSKEILSDGKMPVVLGGEHSAPLGLIEAVSDQYDSIGILHIDAHADLRECYEGFEQSHASIMNNVLKLERVSRLVQVGIRDLSEKEAKGIEEEDRIITFYDWDIKNSNYHGISWGAICHEIVDCLPDQVYISMDIDGLHPSLCPNTGTPVPGGFQLEEIRHLLRHLRSKGKRVVGFDLCEVAPGDDDWDANAGARILWELVVSACAK